MHGAADKGRSQGISGLGWMLLLMERGGMEGVRLLDREERRISLGLRFGGDF